LSAGICTIVVFTLLPSCSSSVRNEAKNPNTACFDAQYAVPPSTPFFPASEAMFTMVPVPASSMDLRNARVTR